MTSLDLIEAVVLLLERGRAAQWPELTTAAVALYDTVTEKIARIPEIERNYGAFFDAIEGRYLRLTIEESSHYLPSWHVRLRDVEGFDVAQQLLGPLSDRIRTPGEPTAVA